MLSGASCVIEADDGPSNWPLKPPTLHRTAPVACELPTYVDASRSALAPRAASLLAATRPAPPPPATPCNGDDDCSALDPQSRCIVRESGNFCHTDQCFTDNDCDSASACDCRPDGNRCLPGDCRVDDDCGPGGYCSPSYSNGCGTFGGFVGHFCRTANDTCVSDSECDEDGTGVCSWVQEAGHWACTYGLCVG